MQAEKFWVVIPNAGIGDRFKSEIPKQYICIHGKTVLEHSISTFLSEDWVAGVIVALASHDTYFQQLPIAQHEKIKPVLGGKTRSDSVMSALSYLKNHAAKSDWVLVHDAVRPCLHVEDLQALVNTLQNEPVGGILAVPVQDTVKFSEKHSISHTVDRNNLWCALTPQMFRLQVLDEALKYCQKKGMAVTDESCAIENYGMKSMLVEAKHPNPKLTYTRDFSLVSLLLEAVTNEVVA